ncbi:MAG: MBL fold metallo-hydrolase [Sneathiella sp.]|nr:MBL fold metallo-hydrolase [Sneathiella sp.]
MTVQVKFWGVRGSIATPSPNHIKYGGNTSCVELILDDQIIIFDAGTGVRNLGDCLLGRGIKDYLFLQSHTHWDHINGFPFFAPIYQEDVNIKIYAGHLGHSCGIHHVLKTQMCQPTFPVPFEALSATLDFQDFNAGESFSLGKGIEVSTAPLNHPDGGTGYRVEYQGVSVCYVTDTEHQPGILDEGILNLIKGADLVIYDCTYTDEEFSKYIGWGHSTWQHGIRLCQEAGASQLAIFHHDPSHDDAKMDQIAQEAQKVWDGAMVAREGMTLELAENEMPALISLAC